MHNKMLLRTKQFSDLLSHSTLTSSCPVMSTFADHDDIQCVPHSDPHNREIHISGEAVLPTEEQVLPVLREPGHPGPGFRRSV